VYDPVCLNKISHRAPARIKYLPFNWESSAPLKLKEVLLLPTVIALLLLPSPLATSVAHKLEGSRPQISQ